MRNKVLIQNSGWEPAVIADTGFQPTQVICSDTEHKNMNSIKGYSKTVAVQGTTTYLFVKISLQTVGLEHAARGPQVGDPLYNQIKSSV
jgi:hypothetical protein